MITPGDIRQKASNLYGDFVRAWLAGDASFFPRLIPSQRTPDRDLSLAIASMRTLRGESKECKGFGYSVEWEEINSRSHGKNPFPRRITIDTQEDFLRLIGKTQEFNQLAGAVQAIRARHGVLEEWMRSNIAQLTRVSGEVEGLLEVVDYLQQNPRPGCFARELPLSVDTKFIERNQKVLRSWLDQILPPHTIRADEEHFERRYGLRYAEPHLMVRFLDPKVQHQLGFSCDVVSVPLHTLEHWQPGPVRVLIVENKVNLLTVPAGSFSIALGGLGNGVSLLRYVPWLNQTATTYWGDLDVEGLAILSSLRLLFPQTRSVFMDDDTLNTWRHLAVAGTGRSIGVPLQLLESEAKAFTSCKDQNLRIEQERIPQQAVKTKFLSLQ